MKFLIRVMCLCSLLTGAVFAQPQVKLTINTQNPGLTISSDFIGLSFETSSLYYKVFDSTNAQMLTIFQELGIKYIRIGGNSVDSNRVSYVPSRHDIDTFFGFVKAAGLKDVIYSLRLENGDSLQDASIAKYIWDNYRQYLTCFAIGNEPNLYDNGDPDITNYSTYLAKWRRFATDIIDSVPDVKLGGPDNSAGGKTWASNFVQNEKGSANVAYILSHYYVVGSSQGLTAQQMINGMLSQTWDTTNYPAYYTATESVAASNGFPFRLTEANAYSIGGGNGVLGGNNGFATSLFALDFMHWWAEHGCNGVSVHTGLFNYNGAVYQDAYGNWQVYPWSYGIKAFEIGGHGRVYPVAITNPDGLNLTAYAVGDTDSLYVTVINKEHGTGVREAEVTIAATGLPQGAAVMYLVAPNGDPTATTGITLGGAAITDTGSFQGRWSQLDSVGGGIYTLKVPATCAAIVKIGGTITSVQPKIPMLIEPNNGASGVPRRASLKWSLSRGATGYNLQVASDEGFANVVFDTTLGDTATQLSTPLSANTKYYWHVNALNNVFASSYSVPDSFTTGTGIDAINEPDGMATKFVLFQNYPNPFNPTTVISYELSTNGYVTLRVYDVLGQEVATLVDSWQGAGNHGASFNAAGHATGVYFYTLRQASNFLTRQMLLLK